MKLQEQIYTSAAELLESGASNLGVLAQTREFPRESVCDLSAQRAYTLLPGLPLEPLTAHPSRLVIGVCGSAKQYLGISQTVYAGADHTGRTRPLTHHVVIKRAEVSSGVSYAAVISAVLPLLRRTWDGPPSWIEPARQIAVPPGLPSYLPSEAWSELLPESNCEATICFAAEVLVAFPHTRRPLLICLPERNANRVIDLIVDILWLLPAIIQAEITAATHIVEASDYIRDAGLLVTYSSTPFLAQTRERQDPRRPIVLDLTMPGGSPSIATLGAYGQELHEAWKSGQTARIIAVGQQWDAWGIKSEQVESFVKTRRFERSLTQATDPAQLSEMAAMLIELPKHPLVSAHIDSCCEQHIGRLERQSKATRWEGILSIFSDARWPGNARKKALDAIIASPNESLSYLLGQPRQAQGIESQVTALLEELLKSHFKAINNVLNTAFRDGSPKELEVGRQICQRMVDCDCIAATVVGLSTASESARSLFRPILLRQFARQVRQADQITALCKQASSNSTQDPGLAIDVCRLVLKPHLEAARSDASYTQLATLMFNLALQCKSARESLEWLTAPDRSRRLNPQLVEGWVTAANGTLHGHPMQQVISNGNLPSYEPQPLVDTSRATFPNRRTTSRHRPPGVAIARFLFWTSVLLTVVTGGLALAECLKIGPIRDWRLLVENTWKLGAGAFLLSVLFELTPSWLLRNRGVLMAGRMIVLLSLIVAIGLMIPYDNLKAYGIHAMDSVRAILPQSAEQKR